MIQNYVELCRVVVDEEQEMLLRDLRRLYKWLQDWQHSVSGHYSLF